MLELLRAVVGPDRVVTDPEALSTRSQDLSGTVPTGPAMALVRPTSTEEVSEVLGLANARQIPVVPQGALTGVAGGANAVAGCILLDLSEMNQIVRIDPVDLVAVVQPGVVTADLAEAVEAQGLFYAPDPASAPKSTMGGNIATNAGGMRCIKYGVTRDAVRTLQVVLADGSVIRTAPPTVKSVTALDLTSLIVGSEGTLGVVTEITVGLLPKPGPALGITASFSSIAAALAAANDIMVSPHRPCTLEFMDEPALAGTRVFDPEAGLPEGAKGWLLVLTDDRATAAADIAEFVAIVERHGALQVNKAEDPALVAGLLRARRALNPAMRAVRGGSLNEDVAVPRRRLPELLAKMGEISERVGLPVATAGHVGDGNLHPIICFDPADAAQERAAHEAHEMVLAVADELGGTISGEHGIGLEKLGAVERELGPRVRGLQRAIKAVLDPNDILNPGKKL